LETSPGKAGESEFTADSDQGFMFEAKLKALTYETGMEDEKF
jgi:hypothetical protein